jgi:HME family heavy-metal exporter
VLDKGRSHREVAADIRHRLSIFSADVSVTQFLTERIQSADNWVRGEIVLKIYGPDLATLRLLADRFRAHFAEIPGLEDLLVGGELARTGL